MTPFRDDYRRRRDDREVKLNAVFDDRVSLVYYYPAMKPDIIDSLVENGYRGIVIAGTGLGHVNKPLYPALDRARAAGVHVYMTVQTLWGYVQMYVYETGREIMGLGVVPAANMLPEVAYMKLGWALGQIRRPRRGQAHHAEPGQRRDHPPRTPQRVPGLPGRDPRGGRVHLLPLEVGRRTMERGRGKRPRPPAGACGMFPPPPLHRPPGWVGIYLYIDDT